MLREDHNSFALFLSVWCTVNGIVQTNEVNQHQAWLVLRWVTVFGLINHLRLG